VCHFPRTTLLNYSSTPCTAESASSAVVVAVKRGTSYSTAAVGRSSSLGSHECQGKAAAGWPRTPAAVVAVEVG